MPFPSRTLAVALIAAGLSGCAITEPALRPTIAMPETWVEAVAAPSAPIEPRWWSGFGSTQLVTLVDEALAGSGDLRIAAERVRQAGIALAIAGAAQLPTAGASAASSLARSDGTGAGAGASRESTSLGVSIAWELDLWGRLAATQRAGEAALRATEFDYDAGRLSVVANVANAYFLWVAIGERLALARSSLETAERVLAIVEARRREGVATALEVAQQRTTVLTLRTALLPLDLQRRQTASAIALLLGRVPQSMALQQESFAALSIPEVAAGLPSSLLLRRPDLAAAEAQLAAADADIAAARAAMLPTLSLSASAGAGSAVLLGLANPATSFSIGASLAQSLFDGGRRRLQVELSRSQRQVLIEAYAQAVRAGLKEVDDGLGNVDRSRRQEAAQQAVVDQAREALRLAELRYKAGAGDLLAVLDAQRVLFNAQDALVSLRQVRLSATVDLFKALGGGWTAPAAAPARADRADPPA